jgi:hypothetical protein
MQRGIKLKDYTKSERDRLGASTASLQPGLGMARVALALMRAKGNIPQAELLSRQQAWWNTPDVNRFLKAAVAEGSTTGWGASLVYHNNLVAEFSDALRPASLLGKIPGLRGVPFNSRIGVVDDGSSAAWITQGNPIPVSKMDLHAILIDFAKIGALIYFTNELVRNSDPAIEEVCRRDLVNAIAQFADQQFIDPSVAAVADTSPASITYGLTAVVSSGSDLPSITVDFKALYQKFIDANVTLTDGCWVMNPRTALFLATLRASGGQPAFEDITPRGGMLGGLPVVTSSGVPIDGAGKTIIVLLNASDIFFADAGAELDATAEATLQAVTNPDTGAQQLISLFQLNLAALKVIRFVSWQRRRAVSVNYISGVTY